jgi:glc operon protein GlcG
MLTPCVILAALATAQPDKPPLVTADRVQLNLAGAELVVDDGGHPLAFARMDDARPASGYTALTKAVAAATFCQETGPAPAKGEPDVILSLSLPAAAAASGGKGTALKGGVPIVVKGQVVGAVGVGGGTGEQDAEVEKAAIDALLAELGAKK